MRYHQPEQLNELPEKTSTMRSCLAYLRGPDATLLSQPQVLVVICVQFLNKCMTSKAIKSGIIFTKYKSVSNKPCEGGRLSPDGACLCAGEDCLPSGS